MSKIFKTWIYHETEEPKIVNSDEVESYFKDGWADSPIEFMDKSDFGIDQDKLDEGDFNEMMKGQQVVEAVKGVTDALNGELNLENMSKLQIKKYAEKHTDLKLVMSKTKPKLIAQIREAMNGDSK